MQRNLKEMKERIRLTHQIIEILEDVMPLFENHELYKLNQAVLNQRIELIFEQIQTRK
ncbi:hypothetical protein [Enterococcus avium]|uniref:hypothetical protein n=1 Tax=Enterococcus avium TaxID=33945 RepID=UPI0021CB7103|nr:hypothetical protein [Enterococcus avium]